MADEAKDENPARTKQDYLVGGLWLKIDRTPDELLAWYREEKKKGMRPSPMLLMIWQRTAIHFSYIKSELETAQGEIKELHERVHKLEVELGRRGQHVSARNVVELLDKAVDDLFDRMPGVSAEMRATGRAHYMVAVALDLCHILAEEAHDQWDPAALREALRDILAACRHARDAKTETTDRMIGNDEDRRGLASMLGLAEDADAQTVMAALARFNAGGGPGRQSPPDAAPV